jgi:hypothetical protein
VRHNLAIAALALKLKRLRDAADFGLLDSHDRKVLRRLRLASSEAYRSKEAGHLLALNADADVLLEAVGRRAA